MTKTVESNTEGLLTTFVLLRHQQTSNAGCRPVGMLHRHCIIGYVKQSASVQSPFQPPPHLLTRISSTTVARRRLLNLIHSKQHSRPGADVQRGGRGGGAAAADTAATERRVLPSIYTYST